MRVPPLPRPELTRRQWLAALAGSLAWVGTASARDWLDIRRRGVPGMLESANEAEGRVPRILRYEAAVPAGHPLHGATLELRRRPMAATRNKKRAILGGTDLVVELRDTKGKRVCGLAREGDTLWVSHGAAPIGTDRALFLDAPTLGAPLALFAVLELAPRYDGKLEGEFEGTAIVRMRPGYTSGPDLEPLKLGVSKRTLQTTVTEVDDSKGEMRARLLMLDLRWVEDRAVAGQLRLRSAKHEQPLDFRLVRELVGADASRDPAFRRWGRAALRAP